jgi:arylsulfatase A-like enzyme
LGSTLGAGAAAVSAQQRGKPSRPNILLILADDLAAWMCGCYGNKEIRTPNIDLLARMGTRFLNAFVVTPVCSPSRATLFTGRTPMQHGIHDFLTPNPVENPPQGQAAPPEAFAHEVMLSDMLAREGYRCGYVGKWHMGSDAAPGHGYEFTYTMLGGSSPYQNPTMSRNGKLVTEGGYLTQLMTQAALEFIERQEPGRPFFLAVSYLNPHTPYDGHPQKYYDLYADTRFETIGWEPPAPNALREKEMLQDVVGNLRKCAASVTALDDQIPVLLDALRRRKLWSDTLIVFTADNGYLLGRHGLWSKGHASDPINMYEEVVGVPLILSWPGEIPVEATRPELVSFYDLLPTLCEAAQAPVPGDRNLCGRSFLTLARGRTFPKGQAWPPTVFGYFRNTQMARDNRFKLVIRNGGEGPNELYYLSRDPREKRNEYDNAGFVTVRDRLRRQLDGWLERYGS